MAFTPADTRDYATATPSTTINVDAAPPTPAQVLAITPNSSKKGLISLSVIYNEPLSSSSASDSDLYHVFAAVTKLVKNHKQTLFSKAPAIRRVSANSSGNTVTINLTKPFNGTVQGTVQGSVTAANGASSSVNTSIFVK
jgi:hypothetical protein